MILERLSVAGFRTFAAPFTFVPDARFTVLHAPNGTGKTTLLDALHYGLLERHSVTGEKARERFASAGRELVPTIEIDFAVGGTQYRLRKTFFGAKSASLQRWEAGRYVPQKENAAADDFVRELFSAELPGRGAIEPTKHLGFAHVLWSPARASFDNVPDVAGDQIRSMLGVEASAVTEGERDVQERMLAEYARFYTSGGSAATGAASMNLPGLEKRVAEARAAVTSAREQHQLVESLTRDYQDRNADAARLHNRRTEVRHDLVTAKDAAVRFAELAQAAERARSNEQAARASYDRLSEATETISALRKERAAVTSDRLHIAAEMQALSGHVESANRRIGIARVTAEDAGAQAVAVQNRAEYVTLAETYVRIRRESHALAATIVAHETDTAALHVQRVASAELLAPSRVELEHLREQVADLAKLDATIAASALALEIDADVDLTIAVVTAEKTGSLDLKAGESAAIAAADDLVAIDVPGLGRIRARGADGAAKARKKALPIAASLGDAWDRFGTSSLPELAARTERAIDLARNIAERERACAERLAGRTIDELEGARAIAAARIAAIEQNHPAWSENPPDAPDVRAAFDRDLSSSADAARTANALLAAELGAKAELDAGIARAATRLSVADMGLQRIAVQLANGENDGLDDAQRAQRLRDCAFELRAAQGARADFDAKLAAFAENPADLLTRLELQEREAGTAFEQAFGQAKMFLARLEMQAKLGTYAKLGACEERLVQLQGELAGALAQAAAIACLREAFEHIRSSRLEAVVAPITRTATRYMNRIAGSPVGEISIGDGFAPLGLISHASQTLIGIESTLSSGEKEQIYLATRLALAEVIADGRGRQLFVVDDAVTATDPNRLRRFIAILEGLSQERLQVIVTTADKSRYLGIAGAKHVDLAAELLAESAA